MKLWPYSENVLKKKPDCNKQKKIPCTGEMQGFLS